MVPKAEGSILSISHTAVRGLGVCQAWHPHLSLSWSSPAAFRHSPDRRHRPSDCCEARLVEARNQGPRGGARAPFTADTPGLGRQSRATLPQPASCQPRREGDRRWDRGLRHPRVTCSLVSEAGGLSTYLEALSWNAKTEQRNF